MMATSKVDGGCCRGMDMDDEHSTEEEVGGCTMLHTRDVSVLSSLSSFDNDDERHPHPHHHHHRVVNASPLRSPIHRSSQTKSSLDLPHLDYDNVLRNNLLPTSSSSALVDNNSKSQRNIVHRRLNLSTFLKKTDKTIQGVAMMSTATEKLSSLPAFSLPSNSSHHNLGGHALLSSSFNDDDDTNDDAISLCSVPHLMRTRDSQDEDDDDHDDINDTSRVGHDDFNDDNDFEEDEEYYNNHHYHHSNSSSDNNNKSIDIVITDNGKHHAYNGNAGFGTELEITSSTLLAFSLISSSQPHHPSFTPQSQLQQHEQQQIEHLLPPPTQNNIDPQTVTPIVCNRQRNKLQACSSNKYSSNNISNGNNNMVCNSNSSNRTSNGSNNINNRSSNIQNRSIRDSSVHNENSSSSGGGSKFNNYVIIIPGQNNVEIEVASSAVPTLPL